MDWIRPELSTRELGGEVNPPATSTILTFRMRCIGVYSCELDEVV